MYNLSPGQSRALAVGLLVNVLLAGYLVMVRPYLQTYDAYRTRLVALEDQLSKFQTLAAGREAILDQLQRVDNGLQIRDHYLPQQTPALASAELQQQLKEVIEAGGGELISTQVVQTQAQEGTIPVTVRVAVRGTIQVVYEIVYNLEAGNPLLFVDNVTLQNLGARRYSRGAEGEQELDVRFDLTGYIRSKTS